MVESKENAIVNRLNKTKEERYPDLAEEQRARKELQIQKEKLLAKALFEVSFRVCLER